MARHNFLVQRYAGTRVPGLPEWCDVATTNHDDNNGHPGEPTPGRQPGTRDEFNNDGFATLKQARKEAKRMRKQHAPQLYRIIQIVS